MRINVEIKDKEIKRLFTRLQRNLSDLTPAFQRIGEIIRSSVIRNFREGGRPDKWTPTKVRSMSRAHAGKQARPGARRKAYTLRGGSKRNTSGKKTLVDTARLQNSITARAGADRVIVGTNLVYARIHQMGGMAGRNKKVRIPARPYLMVQEEDWETMRDCLRGFLMKGAQG